MKRSVFKIVAAIGAVLFYIGLTMVGFDIYRLFYRPMVVSNSEPNIVQIDKSTSASSLVQTLAARHFIQSKRALLTFIRLRGLSQQLKAGVYQIVEGESAAHFLNRVAAGDVLIESFRIIDGTTAAQVSAHLEKAIYLTYHAADWAAIAGTHSSAEGLLLADTYHYDAGSQSNDLLEHAHKNLQQFLEYSWQQRSPNLPYKTSYELLIAASILEKEAAVPREKRLIAGVIANRLRKNMPLQMDPTVIYALGAQYTGKLTREDLHIDSPFNTYRYRGLPPTPIAMVGKDAIDAAAHPEVTDYLYFVARGDGSHYFSVNYDQQKQAVSRYIRK
jgi:UPF0755 protein